MKKLYLYHVDIKEEILITDETTVIGRSSILKCEDNRISRHHGIIKIPMEYPETIHITSTHTNPIFYKLSDQDVNILTKDLSASLKEGDKFSLLPDCFWYVIKFKEDAKPSDPVVNGHVPPKQPGSIRVRNVAELTSTVTSPPRVLPDWLVGSGVGDKRKHNGSSKADDGSSGSKKSKPSDDNENIPQQSSNTSTAITTPLGVVTPYNRTVATPTVSVQATITTPTVQATIAAPAVPTPAVSTINSAGAVSSVAPSDATPTPTSTVTVKQEPSDNGAASTSVGTSSATTTTVPSTSKVKAEPADSSTSAKASCKFGIRCYRHNVEHRTEFAHPGEADYRRPTFPPAPSDAPHCHYASRCYRRNPAHFRQYQHPDSSKYSTSPTTKPPPRNAAPPNSVPVPPPPARPRPRPQPNYNEDETDSGDDDIEWDADTDSDTYNPGQDNESDDDENGDGLYANNSYETNTLNNDSDNYEE